LIRLYYQSLNFLWNNNAIIQLGIYVSKTDLKIIIRYELYRYLNCVHLYVIPTGRHIIVYKMSRLMYYLFGYIDFLEKQQ